ncbi:MAG: hypothetical protein ACTSRA_20810, partial [Promethearchaeota archaeon]
MLALKELYEKSLPKGKMRAFHTFPHVILALFLFDMYGKMGRTKLQAQLGLGRGSLRTFMNRLKNDLGLIQSESTKAHVLTSEGMAILDDIKKEITIISNLPKIFETFSFAPYNALAQVIPRPKIPADKIEKVLDGLRLLDVAKRHGGTSLLSLVAWPGKRLKVLSASMDIRKEYEGEWLKINE